MGKRKMLRNTTAFISVLLILSLLLGTYFLIYRNLSSYNRQIELMQKDILNSLQTKTDDIISDCSNHIVSWMFEKRALEFATEDVVDYYSINRLYEEVIQADSANQEDDYLYGIFRPGQDVFITNRGIIHSWRLERTYGFSSEMISFLATLPQQEFYNNYYVLEGASSEAKRLNIFLKRSISTDVTTEIYGFISLNVEQLSERISNQENNHFMVYFDDTCLYGQTEMVDDLHILTAPSKVVYNLSYANGVEKRASFFIWLLYGLLFAALVCVGLLFGSYLSKRLHKPIEDILHQLSADTNDDAEIYDEAAYIQNRFVAIKTENQQLATQVDAQETYLKQNFIRDLLYGLVSEEKLLEKSEVYHIQDLCGLIVLAILEERRSERPSMVDFSRITAILEMKTESSTVVFLNSKQIIVVSKQPFDMFKKTVTQAILQIGEEQGVSYTGAVVDGRISRLAELSSLLNEAMSCLESSALGYDKLIVSKEDLHQRSENDYYYPMELERSIISHIADRDFDRAMKLLQSILDKNLVELKLSKAALIELKFAIVGTVKRILQVLKKTETEVFGEGTVLYLELSVCKTPSEISDKIYEMFSAIQHYSELAYETNNHALIDSMEKYIHENFNRSDMSLLLLAEHFNLTISYISSIFKKYRQMNFKEYLTAYRIRRATEILSEKPQIRISDLSRMVGYDNVNSFIRNFKKIKQVSPGDYKNSSTRQ